MVKRSILLLLLTSCVANDRGEVAQSSQEVIGGVRAKIGQFPTTVAIVNNKGGLCTGTLIEPDLVLTAAHCIKPSLQQVASQAEVTRNTTIIIDTDNVFSQAGRRIAAKKTIPHPDFNEHALGDNDIGLIRLASPVTDRTPIPINRRRAAAPPGITVKEVGYGVSILGNNNSAGRLHFLAEKTTTNCKAFSRVQGLPKLDNKNIFCFSQTDGKGKCSGDSGGPSYATINGVERVVGVTSFGDQFCRQFGSDTRVDSELDFLYLHAPELQCQADGDCNTDCGQNSLPDDADCQRCSNDSECEDNQECHNKSGQCKALPFTLGGDGYQCKNKEECNSGLCAVDNSSDDKPRICTSKCEDDSDCSLGLECISASDSSSVCWPEESTGWCSTSGGNKSTPFGLLLLGLALFLARKPRNKANS